MASISPSIRSPNSQVLIQSPSSPLSFASPSTRLYHLSKLYRTPLARPSGGRPHAPHAISCKAGGKASGGGGFDRRDVLLGGLAATTLIGLDGKALANPVEAPDITKCHPASVPTDSVYGNKCCPPYNGQEIVDYVLPPVTKLRVRQPAHKLAGEQLEKYKEAVRLMRALPADNPLSFVQQAKIHCAYCNFGYDQVGFPGLELQVHSSWLFLPFHRWYLYFYEKILGKLIGDENFAMPFWNWDQPDGMTMPAIFMDPDSSLYDAKRDPTHFPPVIVDYDDSTETGLTAAEQIESNLCTMYRQIISGAKTTELFFGKKYVAGGKRDPGPGTIELRPHNTLHGWCGSKTNVPRGEDMGQLYAAGYDPMFFCHHHNVDRMWTIWKRVGNGRRKDIDDPDYLEASFLFYDENERLVRVRVKDSLETEKMGYKFQDVEIPWLKRKPRPRTFKPPVTVKITTEPTFPLVLKSPVNATVKRPKKSRTAADKEKEEEVLSITGIQFDRTLNAKFDVYINAPDNESLGPGPAELAGSFVNVPQKANEKDPSIKTNLLLGISDLLDDIKADDDDSIIVTIVPRRGRNKIKIDGIQIQFSTI